MAVRNNTHELLKDVMGDKTWTARALGVLTDKPEYAITSTLRGMHMRKEVTIIKPQTNGAPYFYRLTPKFLLED